MDKDIIDKFWQQRATQSKGRWTESSLMDFELGFLANHVTPHCRILDLGSGPALLSRLLMTESATLTAVDKYQGFLDKIPPDPRITKICSDVVEFQYPIPYNLILLFGVVTHLEPEEELRVYENALAGLSPSGVLVVKNQVSLFEEKRVDTYSKNLDCRYVGRYPDIPGQTSRLRKFFGSVETLHYPKDFNKWADTKHVAFICSGKA